MRITPKILLMQMTLVTTALTSCGKIADTDASQINIAGQEVRLEDRRIGQNSSVIIGPVEASISGSCGGVLLTPTKVITSTACMEFGSRVKVLYEVPGTGDSFMSVEGSITPHYGFKPQGTVTFDGDVTTGIVNDLAIVILDRPIPSNYLTPAKINTRGPRRGAKLFAVGFGDGHAIDAAGTRSWDRGVYFKQRVANGKIVGQAKLGSSAISGNTDRENIIAARGVYRVKFKKRGNYIQYACKGDAGSGLFNEAGQLEGIMSKSKSMMSGWNTVDDCDSATTYYSLTFYYKGWIRSNFR